MQVFRDGDNDLRVGHNLGMVELSIGEAKPNGDYFRILVTPETAVEIAQAIGRMARQLEPVIGKLLDVS